MTELLTCPFCGGKAEDKSYRSCDCCGKAYNGQICCSACEASVSHLDNDAEAVEAWNTRAVIAAMTPGEPVVWQFQSLSGHWSECEQPSDDDITKIGRDRFRPLYAAPAMPATDAMRGAARAVIARWETPAWKDAPATAVYINALKTALSHPSQGGWQPIETAPKDGSEFLTIYSPDGGEGSYWIVFFNGDFFEEVSGGFKIEHSTHWQPLPAPPEVQP